MKLSTAIILSFTIFATGCTIQAPKQAVYYGPGTFYAKWQKAILKECNNKAVMITLQMADEKIKEGYIVTQEDVIRLHKYLVEKCSLNSGIVI